MINAIDMATGSERKFCVDAQHTEESTASC